MEGLEVSSRKLEIPREDFMQRWEDPITFDLKVYCIYRWKFIGLKKPYFQTGRGGGVCLLTQALCAMLGLVTQACLTLFDPMDCRLLGPWGFSRQKYWSGLPCPPPGDPPNPGIEPRSPALQAEFTDWATRGAPLCMHSNLCLNSKQVQSKCLKSPCFLQSFGRLLPPP